jgi:hypothetical protein
MKRLKDGGIDFDYYYEITSRTRKKVVMDARSRSGRVINLIRFGIVVLLSKALRRK